MEKINEQFVVNKVIEFMINKKMEIGMRKKWKKVNYTSME